MSQSSRLNLPSGSAKQQVANRAAWNEVRRSDEADFFTLGYTGRKTEEVLDALVGAGVRTLIDIRQNPISMYRPDLSKSNWQRALEKRGITYVHAPELGVPRDIRAKAIATGTRDVIWKWYDEHVVEPYVGRNLHHFLNSVEHPVAMMCTETDPTECHRHRLAVVLEQHGLRGFDL